MNADIRAVLFDKDGTLFDFRATWEAWAEAFLLRLAEGDRDHAAAMGAQIGFDLGQARFDPRSVVIAGTPQEVVDALLPSLPGWRGPAVLDLLNEEAAHAPQREVVPLAGFLDGLRRNGLKLGVATNDAEAPARAHLAAADVEHRFDFIAGFDSGHGGKPAPGQLLAFAERVRVPPQQIAMVGDSRHDLVAGRAAGMRTVAVLTGLATSPELEPLADVVLDHIGDLPVWLGLPLHPGHPGGA